MKDRGITRRDVFSEEQTRLLELSHRMIRGDLKAFSEFRDNFLSGESDGQTKDAVTEPEIIEKMGWTKLTVLLNIHTMLEHLDIFVELDQESNEYIPKSATARESWTQLAKTFGYYMKDGLEGRPEKLGERNGEVYEQLFIYAKEFHNTKSIVDSPESWVKI